MSFAVSLSQLVLVVVFASAGFAKLTDRTATAQAIEAFGVSPRLAPAGAVALPIVELAIAVGLVPAATARWAALAGVALLGIFSVAIVRALRTGAKVDCNCFGGLTQTEVGRGTLLRNSLLGALAGFVALGGESVGAFRWFGAIAPGDRVAIALMLAGLVALGCFCWRLLQQNGRLLLELEAERPGGSGSSGDALPALEPGTPAPPFVGRDLQGEQVSLESLLAPGLPVALFFTNPGCGACEEALDAVARAQRERSTELSLAVISSGSIDRIEAKAAEFGLDRVVAQDDDVLFDAYHVYGVPGIVAIDEHGSIARPAALGATAVREVVLGYPARPGGVQVEVVAR